MNDDIRRALKDKLGDENVAIDADTLEAYGSDWTRFESPDPLAVVFVKSVDQIVDLVEFANEHTVALVPSGGRTGLSGGAVASHHEIVVSFEKMNRILEFDEVDGLVRVEAGVVTAVLQDFARDKGLYYPVDFASSGSSQIGGNIATNAGGIKVLRYGLTRDQVFGLKVVTGRGDVLELNRGLVKNATGYDLRHLFIGSEGTLGFVVEATIRLVKPPTDLAVVLLAVPSMGDVMEVLAVFRDKLDLTAYEFFSNRALAHVLAHHDLSRPLSHSSDYYVLLEFEQSGPAAMEDALAAFQTCVDREIALDGVVSQNDGQREDLWKYREYISESISAYTPYKNDVSVRVSKVPAFLSSVERKVAERYPDFEVVWFGHIGDGNLHLNVLKPEGVSVEDFRRECECVSEELLAIVAEFEGSISAEHGVGLLKRDQLGFSRTPEEIDLMRAVKRVFDPNGIMNPGKLLTDL